jgi:hypothetical protein
MVCLFLWSWGWLCSMSPPVAWTCQLKSKCIGSGQGCLWCWSPAAKTFVLWIWSTSSLLACSLPLVSCLPSVLCCLITGETSEPYFYMLHPVLFLLTLLMFSWHIINFIVISAKYMCVFSLPLSVGISHIIKAILWHRWAVTTTSRIPFSLQSACLFELSAKMT